LKDDLEEVLPDIETINKFLDAFVEQFYTEVEGIMKQINGSVSHIPRKIAITGDVQGFTTLRAAIVYGTLLSAAFFGS
jgi:hypothetical protein